MGEPIEMRKELRYRLDAPLVFSWEGVGLRRFLGEGITRDVSLRGAFILTTKTPPPDCTLRVDILLSYTGLKTIMRITGKARVLRLERPSSDTWLHGFAVVTHDLDQWGLVPMHTESESALAGAARAH